MDGKGYPDGLVDEQLDDLTKILIVVDSYDAMTSRRNYRKNMSMEQALEELYNCSGTQFEPNTVEFFARSIVDFTPTKSVFSEEYLENVYKNKSRQ
jgi:HD-GYP domain-containing protein (c-di-GMP phosphodiesterase class II)